MCGSPVLPSSVSSAWNTQSPIAAGLHLHILKVVPYTQMALIRGLPDHTSLNWFHPLLYQFFSSMELFTIWPVLLICLSQWRQEAFPTISFISPFLFISSNHFIPPASRSAYLMVIRKKYLLNKLVNTFLIIGISYFQIVYSNGINKWLNLLWDAFRFVIRGMISYWNAWTIAFLHFSQYIVNNEAKTLMEEVTL